MRGGYIGRVGQDVSICYRCILKYKRRALLPAHVGVIEIRTLPQQSVKKLIKIYFVASPKTEISQIDLFLLTQQKL